MQNKARRKFTETVKRLIRSKKKYNLGMKRLNETSYEWDF